MSISNSLEVDGFPSPVGAIIPCFQLINNDPTEAWYSCDGRSLSKADYPELYAVIGDAFQVAATPADSFSIPDLNNADQSNFIFPQDKTVVSDGTDGGVVPASIQIDQDDGLEILTANIPALSAANFTYQYPKYIKFSAGNTMATQPLKTCIVAGTATNPSCIKSSSSKTGSGAWNLTAWTPTFKNPDQVKINTIQTDSNHGINFGGVSTNWIIKVSSFLTDPTGERRRNWDNITVQARARTAELAAEAVALSEQTDDRNQQADDEAQKAAVAVRDNGQGGGTEVPFEDVPALSGYVIPPNPPF
tara:strand:- start:12325 stop:13236 length:912 start_codon:yes stop_codon:yes gene_type:complete